MSAAGNIHHQPSANAIGSAVRPARILIVDGEAIIREILARKLTSLGYSCECYDSARKALDLLTGGRFDLILADVLMPRMGGIAFLDEAMRICPDVAVILVTSVVDIELAVEFLKHGAYDYISKPFDVEEVSASVSRALEKRLLLLENRNYQRTLEEQVASRTSMLEGALGVLEHTYRSTLIALSKALDSRDADSEGHSVRVTAYAVRMARQLRLEEPEIKMIEKGVLLHDIGKIGIPDKLLRKTGELEESERILMRRHPEIGYQILTRIKFLTGAAQVVLQHHERYDGKGYPQGLKGDDIDLGARIFAVANALEELTSDHHFEKAANQETADFESAIEEIKKMSGTQVDPQIVREFLKIPVSDWKKAGQELGNNGQRPGFLQIGLQR
jgi:putative nucleotidyltransferase with HDIG domain